jgi:endonuclease YncB( thermonuclease family)
MKILLVILLISSSLLLYFFGTSYFAQESYSHPVLFVSDGDSFQLEDGRRIRLLAVDAPEKDRCGHQEAYNRLKELIQGKEVTLSDTLVDDYGRQLANVYVGSYYVNDILVSEGLVKYTYVKNPESSRLKQSSDLARSEQRGIYSSVCRSIEPVSECDIKGNRKNGKQTYFLPQCPNYNQTIIDTSFGDAWFCTEQEAQRAGFIKASGCP